MIRNTETTETIREKVAKILKVDPKYVVFAEYELKELPVLQDPHVLQQLLDTLQYGKDNGKLDDLCKDLGSPIWNGKGSVVFLLGGALKLLMHDLGIDPKGGAR